MLEIKNLTLGYSRHPIVHHMNLSVADGEMLAVIGPNGGGKSTLLNGIMGILKPLEGSVEKKPGIRIAYCQQASQINKSFPITVREFVSLGLWHRTGLFRRVDRSMLHLVDSALEKVKMRKFAGENIGDISGGQFQRVVFARVWLQDADLIMLDEPFSAMDEPTSEELAGLLQEWNRAGKTIITVMHNLNLVRRFFPETVILAREIIASGKTAECVTAENIEKAVNSRYQLDYTAGLCTRTE